MLQLRLVEFAGRAVEVASSALQSGASSAEQQAETKFESHEGVECRCRRVVLCRMYPISLPLKSS